MHLAPVMNVNSALQQQIKVKLHLLDPEQQVAAGKMITGIHQSYIDNDQKLSEFVEPEKWFIDLPKKAQQQVIDLFATLVFGHGDRKAVLTWYDARRMFRYERPIHPAP